MHYVCARLWEVQVRLPFSLCDFVLEHGQVNAKCPDGMCRNVKYIGLEDQSDFGLGMRTCRSQYFSKYYH